MYKQILIPIDGSELSLAAIEQGLALASGIGAAVTFFNVIVPLSAYGVNGEQLIGGYEEYARAATDAATRRLADAAARARALGVSCRTRMIESERPYQAIIDAANEAGCDLIAMASHGRRGLGALVLGSETLKVLTHSSIPVLVFREPRGR